MKNYNIVVILISVFTFSKATGICNIYPRIADINRNIVYQTRPLNYRLESPQVYRQVIPLISLPVNHLAYHQVNHQVYRPVSRQVYHLTYHLVSLQVILLISLPVNHLAYHQVNHQVCHLIYRRGNLLECLPVIRLANPLENQRGNLLVNQLIF